MPKDGREVSESMEEAYETHNSSWGRRPHMGPSGPAFEQYKEGGTDQDGASYNEEQGYDESRSLDETFSSGIVGKVKGALFGDGEEAEYKDLGEEVEGEHGVIDPSEYNVGPVQEWVDERLEEDDYKAVERVLAKEVDGERRKGVLTYVEGDDLRDENPDEVEEMIQAFDPEDKSTLDPASS